MLHLLLDKNKLFLDHNFHSVKEYMAVYDILNHTCKDTDLSPYVKQQTSIRDSRGAFFAIHSKWLGPNHVRATVSKIVSDESLFEGEKP